VSNPDYPLLTVPGYELYQLAHLTTVAVDALARHRRAAAARDHPGRRAAAVEVPTKAANASSARAKASAGGFPAAAGALPSPGGTAPESHTRTRRNNTEARPGHPAAARPAPSSRQAPAP
jgi:hypothetical protein